MTGEMPGAQRSDVRLGTRRWPELEAGPLLLVPLGAVEQHGPGLPVATDSMVAAHVAERVAAARAAAGDAVLVAPALSYGASGEHEDFPGTISIGHRALRLLLVEFARSACRWAGGLVFVNGHGGNVPTLAEAVTQLRDEGRAVAWTTCAVPGDAHAGDTETSMLLSMAPGLVRTEVLAPGDCTPITELMPRLQAQGVRAISSSGVLGDPTGATPERGRALLDSLVQRLDAELATLDVDDRGRLRDPVRPAAPA